MATQASAEDISLLPELRALYECHTQISRVSNRHTESLGLTGAQFDVLATLGDMPGMTCKALGEATLITKGTLKPVLDRLEDKGLLTRSKDIRDSRQTLVALTPTGQALFESTFYRHVDFMREYFDRLAPEKRHQLTALLRELRQVFA
ncbi:MAG: MarR family transcriptional regulator [Cyanobacteria bacterium RYN_339]|nr:MarR family transcriptional regulator [Cyanobacteria bacterium RYN_339]